MNKIKNLMPILGKKEYINFKFLNKDRSIKNHSQSLERLKERGGICYQEALALINDCHYLKYKTMSDEEIKKILQSKDFLQVGE